MRVNTLGRACGRLLCMDPGSQVATEFTKVTSDSLLNRSWPKIKACIEPLSQEEVNWQPPTASLSSISDTLKHLSESILQTIAACNGSSLGIPQTVLPNLESDKFTEKESLITEIEEELKELTDLLKVLPSESLAHKCRIGASETTLMEVIAELGWEFATACGEISQQVSGVSDSGQSCSG